jgi:Carboxypeptidase regulatory-like domain
MSGEAYSWGMGCGRFSGLSARGLMVWVVVCCLSCGAMAQGIAGSVNAVLPDAPAPVGDAQASGAQGVGVIAGTVTDSDGALVAGAHVTLTGDAVKGERTAVSDGAGRFRFEGVAAGEFRLTVTAKGLAMGEAGGTLQPGAVYEAPAISLRVATANSEVDVSPGAQRAIAEEEVKTEEKQRVLAIVPNYFVTYDKNPMPLDAKQKFDLGWHVVLDPTHFLFSAVAAGIEQADDTFPGFGQDAAGYGQRYGADLATSTTSALLRGSVFPALFRQDPRYFYKGTGSDWARTKYALSTAVICKGDNGRWQANYSGILAGFASGGISNLYYAPSDRHGAGLTLENGALDIVGVGVGHLLQEFLFRRFTPHAGAAPQP